MAAGSEAASLFDCTDCVLWRAALRCYNDVLKLLSQQKKGKVAKREEGLVELDTWFQTSLPKDISSREKPSLLYHELVKLMKWKLKRGKFRPRLTELVQQNDPEDVTRLTEEAFAALPNLERAVKILVQLKAVGPATASAILCAGAPDHAPFMADESVLAVPGLGKLEYNLKHYLAYARSVRSKAKQLNEIDSSLSEAGCDEQPWTPHSVELALWSHHFAKRLKPELLENEREGSTHDDAPDLTNSDKRDSSSDCESGPPRKKKKKNNFNHSKKH